MRIFMRLLLWFLALLSSPLAATISRAEGKEQISVTSTGAPSSFVNHVNTIFGNLLYAWEDIPSSGPHSLPLIRYYNSQISDRLWIPGTGMTSNYPLWIRGCSLDETDEYAYAIAEEDGGSIVCCVSKVHEKDMSFYLDPETIHKGLTNASGEISAKTNLKNTHFQLHGHWKKSHEFGVYLKGPWKSFLSDGGEREYFSTVNFEDMMNIKSETRPDTTELSFHYSKKYVGYLKGIKAKSPHHTFGWLEVEYHPKHKYVEVSSSTGSSVRYSYDEHHRDALGNVMFLEKAEATDRPTERYSYDLFHDRRYLSKISYPDGRYLKFHYDSKGRVTEQKAPVNLDGSEKTIFTFHYHPDRYNTEVFDAEGHKTIYRYSSRDRLTHIEKYESASLYRGEEFFWGKRESTHRGERDDSDEGHLLAKAVYDGNRKILSSERYHYDDHGNIIQEALYGNLSGGCATLFSVSDEGHPNSAIEGYHKHFTYSDDRFHLKTSQREDFGPRIEYEYIPKTNLLIARLTYDGPSLKIREFFQYDEEGILIKKTIDNGFAHDPVDLSGVTERRVTYIVPVHEGHGIGLPEYVTECYTDLAANRDVRLKHTKYSYIKAGLVEREEVYDASDCLRYTLCTRYDGKNRPYWKTDAIGREHLVGYDDNGNKTREELVGSGVFTTYTYDTANRLRQKCEHHSDGIELSTSYTYDTVGNVLSEMDSFGQTTTYAYDSLNRVRQITLPVV